MSVKKSIVRWTVGGLVEEDGFICLERSIYFWKKNYGEKFNYFICCNNKKILSKLQTIKGVNLIDQNDFVDSLPFCPKDTFWKFCPPRLDLKNHEIIIDNDLLVYKKSPTIDWFLSQNKKAITTAAHIPMHGCFKKPLKNTNLKINTGLLGLPPNFDLGAKLKNLFRLFPYDQNSHCDDQGAFLMICKKMLKIIPMEEIYVCNPNENFAKYKKGDCGIHFAGLNKGLSKYWNIFLNSYNLYLKKINL